MKVAKYFVLIFTMGLFALQSSAQTPLNGRFFIRGVSDAPSSPTSNFSIEGTFTDPNFIHTADGILKGDIIVDFEGKLYRIDKLTKEAGGGSDIIADVTYMSGAVSEWNTAPAVFQTGALFHPTPNGYPLMTYDPENSNDNLRVAIQNSAVKDIDRDIRGFKSGTEGEIPKTPKFGDIFYNVTEKKLYAYTANGWVPLGSGVIATGTSSEFPNPAKAGEMFYNNDNDNTFIYNGVVWFKIATNGSTPSGTVNPDPLKTKVREGDLFHNTSDHKLYVYNGSIWVATDNSLPKGQIFIGNASNVAVPVTLGGDATLNEVGKLTIKDLAVNNDKLDKKNIPLSGFGRPIDDVEMGDPITKFRIKNLNYPQEASDAATMGYVDGLFKDPAAMLKLKNNHFFVGNGSDMAIETAKNLIPVSGFDKAMDHLKMGVDGPTGLKYKIINMADPDAPQDAATRNYVDTKSIAPGQLNLLKGNLFMGNISNKASATLPADISLSVFGLPAKELSMGGFKLINLKDPEVPQDAATKIYVDNKVIVPSNLSLTAGNIFVGDINGKAADVLASTVPLNGFGAPMADILMSGFTFKNLKDPEADLDAVTKKYVDHLFKTPSTLLALPDQNMFVGDLNGKAIATHKNKIPLSGFSKALGDIEMGDGMKKNRIVFLAEPKDDTDAATKKYVDTQTSKTGSLILPSDHLLVGDQNNKAEAVAKGAIPITDFGSPARDLSFRNGLKNFKIVNLKNPEEAQDAATKHYVDSLASKTQVGPNPPANPAIGDTYFNTTDKRLYVYNGTDWVPVGNDKLATGNLFVGNTSGVATATPKNEVSLTGFGVPVAPLPMNNQKITNLAIPTLDMDATNKKYVDDGLAIATAGGKDNLGNHQATKNLMLSVNSISNDGLNGKGLSFDVPGNATLGQDLTINGNLFTPSDRRLKDHIETLGNVLQKIDQIRGVSFEYKNKHKYLSGSKIGVIAQELQKVYPEMVTQGKDGFLKVDYTQLTGMLIQAVKEQQKEIEALKIRMDRQQEQINHILEKMKK
ncbi:tail fiber domain-containing protein [Pedobacter caeni]|uniref:Chaperone of endosialidase n=1 Tax=Pedobacter caeni TaxID=288992 RepID=A0A1M5LLK0_9SPHI|nr:tail fiber domain-containing protein [Pedobacter caeni]SHG65223.1 Chaperone of endosialidase [Pedobacter caeni]